MTDPRDDQLVAEWFDRTGITDTLQATEVEPDTWANSGLGVDLGLARGAAKAGRAIELAAAVPLAIIPDAIEGTTKRQDSFFQFVDETGTTAVEHYTPGANEIGKAGQVLGGLAEMAAPLMAGGGNPTLLVGSAGLNSGADLVNEGVDGDTAARAGFVDTLAVGAGFKIPFLGKSLFTRLASGVAGNLAVGSGSREANAALVGAAGYDAVAESLRPDATSAGLDVGMGLLFGGFAHVGARSAEAAKAAAEAARKARQAAIAAGEPVPRVDVSAFFPSEAIDDFVAQRTAELELKAMDRYPDEPIFDAAGNVTGTKPGREKFVTLTAEERAELDFLRKHAGDTRKLAAAYGLGIDNSSPAVRDALLAANNAAHARASAPVHGDATALAQHDANLDAAIDQLLRGEPVQLPHPFPPQAAPAAPADYVAFRRALESGGRADAANPNSSALGIDQFTEGTWLRTVEHAKPAWAAGLSEVELLALRTDPVKSGEMAAALDAENARVLHARGAPVDAVSLYAAHHFGAEHGVKFALADGATPVEQLLTPAQIHANPYLRGKTKAQVVDNWLERAHVEGHYSDAELDAPHFGLPEPTRPLADADPRLTETHTFQTPERLALREQIVASHFEGLDPTPEAAPVAYVMGGGGASGKGTILRLLKGQGVIPEGLVEIDPDAIKAQIPEYGQLLALAESRAAAVVHEESSQLAKDVLARAIEGRKSLVLDRTLGDKAKGLAELQALKAAGYRVHLVGVTLDPRLAVARAVKRAKGSGRFVPLHHLLAAHKGFAGAFADYAALADHALLFDNGVHQGQDPRLLAEAEGGRLRIHAKESYNRMAERSRLNEQAETLRALDPGAEAGAAGAELHREGAGRDADPGRDAAGDQRAHRAGEPPGPRPGLQALDPVAFPVQGATAQVVTERGLRLPVRYAIVDVADLVTSHDDALAVNPDFPAELQPRDRDRAASEQQIARIAKNLNPELLAESPKAADGAPIVGQDRVVESGNARTIAVRRAYASGHADAYRAFLVDEAERFGLDPAAVDGVAQPMLVRVALADYDRAEFARQANESTVAAMSVTEQAQADARRLPDLATLVANDDGTLNARASAPFVREFLAQVVGPNELGAMSTADGDLSQQGVARIRNAVFARAYGDADLVALLAEATDANIKNILGGMLRAAAPVARLREMIAEGGRYGPDITPDLVAAVRKFAQLRSDGTSVAAYLAQGDIFGGGLAPAARDLLRTVGDLARAPKQFAEFLGRWVEDVERLGDPRQADLLGGGPKPDAAAAASRAAETTRQANAAPKPAGDLFGLGRRPSAAVEPVVTPENRAAYEAIAAMPDLVVMNEAGEPVPARELLAQAEAEAQAAATDAAAIEAAANCFLRSAA